MAKSEPLLAAIGDVIDDVVVWLEEPLRYGSDTRSRIAHRRGGSAANVAVFASSLGVRSRFIGQVGDDPTGDALLRDLTSHGVDCRVIRGGATGSIVVLVDASGERSMLTDRGAAPELARLPDGALDGVALLHLPAYSLLPSELAVTALAARQQIGRLSIDTSSIEVLTVVGAPAIAALKPWVIFCGEAEFELIGPRLAPTVVVKRGERPTWLFVDGERHEAAPPPAVAVDTTGAGDALAAGYLAALLRQASPLDALQAGQKLAAAVLSQPGASLPTTRIAEPGSESTRKP